MSKTEQEPARPENNCAQTTEPPEEEKEPVRVELLRSQYDGRTMAVSVAGIRHGVDAGPWSTEQRWELDDRLVCYEPGLGEPDREAELIAERDSAVVLRDDAASEAHRERKRADAAEATVSDLRAQISATTGPPGPLAKGDRLETFRRVLAMTERGRKWTDEAVAELIAMVDAAQSRIAEMERMKTGALAGGLIDQVKDRQKRITDLERRLAAVREVVGP